MSKSSCRPSRLWRMCIVVGLAGIIVAAASAKPKKPARPKKPVATKSAVARPKKPARSKKPAVTRPTATQPAPAKSPDGKAVTIKQTGMRIAIATKGTFDAAGAREIRIAPKAWSPRAGIKVVYAARRGSRVKKGQALLKLDTKEIDEAIADGELTQQVAAMTLKLAEASFAARTKTHKLDLAAAERSMKQANEDYQRYLKIKKPMAIQVAHRGLKSAEQSLGYVKEELRQLLKMYEADDLTEETEEIIVLRQRYAVERAEFAFNAQKLATEKTLKIDIPRQAIAARAAHARKTIARAKTRLAMETAYRTAKIELTKLKTATARSAAKFKQLRADRNLLTVTSPADGMLIHGAGVDGVWSKLTRELKRDDKIMPGEVAMTIITPGRVTVRTKAPEAEMNRLRTGMACEVMAGAMPKRKLAGRVSYVDPLPVGGSIAMIVELARLKPALRLLPGMGCNVKVLVYDNPKAVTVPAGYVHADAKGRKVVWVRAADGSVRSRGVRVGRTAKGQTEITRGLKPGAVVLPGQPTGCK